jgi:hypothetical protein
MMTTTTGVVRADHEAGAVEVVGVAMTRAADALPAAMIRVEDAGMIVSRRGDPVQNEPGARTSRTGNLQHARRARQRNVLRGGLKVRQSPLKVVEVSVSRREIRRKRNAARAAVAVSPRNGHLMTTSVSG